MRGETMVPPADVHQTCSWGGGATAGQLGGAVVTVITGHVNFVGQGRGVLSRVAELRPGDQLRTVSTNRTRATWSVTGVVAYVKAAGIPEAVFTHADSGRRTLRLITCGGQLEANGNYDDNVVVTAVLE